MVARLDLTSKRAGRYSRFLLEVALGALVLGDSDDFFWKLCVF